MFVRVGVGRSLWGTSYRSSVEVLRSLASVSWGKLKHLKQSLRKDAWMEFGVRALSSRHKIQHGINMERTHVLGRICLVVVLFVHFFYSKSYYVALDDLELTVNQIGLKLTKVSLPLPPEFLD